MNSEACGDRWSGMAGRSWLEAILKMACTWLVHWLQGGLPAGAGGTRVGYGTWHATRARSRHGSWDKVGCTKLVRWLCGHGEDAWVTARGVWHACTLGEARVLAMAGSKQVGHCCGKRMKGPKAQGRDKSYVAHSTLDHLLYHVALQPRMGAGLGPGSCGLACLLAGGRGSDPRPAAQC